MMSEKRRATAARIKAENANKIQTDEYIGSRQPLTKERWRKTKNTFTFSSQCYYYRLHHQRSIAHIGINDEMDSWTNKKKKK